MSEGGDAARPAARKPFPRLLFYVLVFLAILVPFLYWQGVWFGKELTLAEIERMMVEPATPERQLQHALSQLMARVEGRDPAAEPLVPVLIRLTSHRSPEIRKTVAWVLGGDKRKESFREAARGLITDDDVVVRRQAALALAAHGDAAGRPELRAMLEPLEVRSTVGGRVQDALRAGEPVRRGTLLARVTTREGRQVDTPSPIDGKVESAQVAAGAEVAEGGPICRVASSREAVLSALSALYFVGTREDAELVKKYASGMPGMGDDVQRQAALTLQRIEAK